eukprot:135296_1
MALSSDEDDEELLRAISMSMEQNNDNNDEPPIKKRKIAPPPSDININSMSSNITCTQSKLCKCYGDLINVLTKYNKSELMIIKQMNVSQLTKVFDDYIHLMHHHDDNLEFDLIVQELGLCNLKTCVKFRRNNRNRMVSNNCNNTNNSEIHHDAFMDILDSIHCFFQHCYDVGYRLSPTDLKGINATITEQKHTDEEYANSELTNQQIVEILKIIKEKKQKNEQFYVSPRCTKYNQLVTIEEEEAKQGTNMKYDFGILFDYNTDDVDGVIESLFEETTRKKIKPKYKSLKQEFLFNPYHTLNMEQFNNEYRKAEIK